MLDAPAAVTISAPVVSSTPLRGVQAQLAHMLRQGSTTLQSICERFTWQPHSARAVVTRLRQTGLDIALTARQEPLLFVAKPIPQQLLLLIAYGMG